MSILSKEEQIEIAWAQHLARFVWPTRFGLTAALRHQLCEQQNWRCCYCGIRMDGVTSNDADAPTFEHILPRSRGGSDELSNIVIACLQCNGARADNMGDIHGSAAD